jgi:hypothetical protein
VSGHEHRIDDVHAASASSSIASGSDTANILMSLVIDKFGWFGMEVHALTAGDCWAPP